MKNGIWVFFYFAFLILWLLPVTHVVLNAAGWKSVSRLMQDPQLPGEQLQGPVHDPGTQGVIPKGSASMGDCPSSPIHAKWATQNEAADTLCMQAIRDWLYDDRILTC